MATDEQTPTIMTIKEASELLRVHPETLRRAIRAGELKAARLGHRTVRIAKDDLIAWFREKGGDQLYSDAKVIKPGRPKPSGKRVVLLKHEEKNATKKTTQNNTVKKSAAREPTTTAS